MDITLLDGGLGQELIHRAGDRPTPLWSTQVMLDHPGMVAQVHNDYFDAGATIATTNTYMAHHDRIFGTDLEGQYAELITAALAEAVISSRPGTRIAGAIGPLRASYRPDIHPSHEEAVPLYAEVARALAQSCDLIICETVVSVAHAKAVMEGAQDSGLPIWIGFSVDDTDGTRLRSGENLSAALAVSTGAAAVLVNCSAPEAVGQAMPILAAAGLPFGGYANGFTKITTEFLADKPTVAALAARKDITPDVYAAHAMGWIGQGATIVGGCCEVGPAHIAALAAAIRAAGHRIV